MILTRSTICLIKIFKQNVFSLFQLLERLTIIYAVHFFLDSLHIFSLIMKLFTKQSPQILKILVISGFLFSFMCLEGR